MTLETRYPSFMTAAEVSSQEDSIPRMISDIIQNIILGKVTKFYGQSISYSVTFFSPGMPK